MDKTEAGRQERPVERVVGLLPKEPPPGLLMSMALRYDHALGCHGYYDGINEMLGRDGPTHAQRLASTLTQMRQLYEEVSGHGFYSPEREAEYAALLPTAQARREATSPAAPCSARADGDE